MYAYDLYANLDVECSQCFYSSALAALGLVIIALGTGGIKPCVSAFGGDQFKDDQVHMVHDYLSKWQSIYYNFCKIHMRPTLHSKSSTSKDAKNPVCNVTIAKCCTC